MNIEHAFPNLSPAAARVTLNDLLSSLPQHSGDPADKRAPREEAAIAAVAALHPAAMERAG